eukprot:TRINITY_DN28335_c0_g1_i1.p1 TRINITY_DN28335_c0_g1~~TRINITY_DN28335_c0_g1_i1.p1  ORF type:complete len:1027 (+),score=207.84 TRINITY_DN28335_c0_g1_i1:81-3083(+)
MASFYGTGAATSFYGAANWYNAADLLNFGDADGKSATSSFTPEVNGARGLRPAIASDAVVCSTAVAAATGAGVSAVAAAGRGSAGAGGYGARPAEPSPASGGGSAAAPAGAVSSVAVNGGASSSGHEDSTGPSFYRPGARGAASALNLRGPRPAPERERGSSTRNGTGVGRVELDDENAVSQAPAGNSMSIAPKRPDRTNECRALDKDMAACSSPDELLQLAESSSSTMDGANWANFVYALAHLRKHNAMAPSWVRNNARWSRSCEAVRPHLPQLTARDTCNVLWSLATLDARDEPAFLAAADALGPKLATCDPVSVSKAAWSLTAVANRDRRLALYSQLAVPIVLRAESFPLGALTMTCYGFAKAAHMDSEVYGALSTALRRYPVEELRPIDVCNVVWAFCTVGYRDDELFDWLCAGHFEKRDSVVNFNPQDLTNTCWGLSKVAYVNEAAMDTLAWGSMQQRDSFKPIHFSNLFYSYATFRLNGPDGFLASMADFATTRIDGFDHGNLAITVWALAQLQFPHPFVDRALEKLRRPDVCGTLQSRTLSMLFLAFFRLGRIADIDSIFEGAFGSPGGIGASGYSALMMTAEQYIDGDRETRLRQGMADEADDVRMRACIGNASAVRLLKRGQPQEARRVLERLRETKCWSAVSAHIMARLDDTEGAAASGVGRDIWVHPVVSGIHPIAATRQNEGPHAYTREFMTLQSVLCNAPAGDVDACMAAVEEFAESRSLWLKITAWEKAVVVHEVAKLARPKVAIEIGGYVGYSAMNIARALRPFGGRVASIEVDPVHVCIVRNMVEYAGLTDNVDVWSGYCFDVFPHLLKEYGPKSIGMVFMDQKGTRFHTDLAKLEELDLLADGAVILADNVLKPGAPIYIWHLCHGPYIEPTAVSVREFLLQSEDWMVMGFYDPKRPPVLPPNTQLNRIAFESDAFRKRSMFDSVSPSKSDWWAFSQRFVNGLERCGCKPRIVGLHGRDNPLIQPADIAAIFERAGRLPDDYR